MTCQRIDGLWYAVIKETNNSYMGFAPSLKDAMTYCWELKIGT